MNFPSALLLSLFIQKTRAIHLNWITLWAALIKMANLALIFLSCIYSFLHTFNYQVIIVYLYQVNFRLLTS